MRTLSLYLQFYFIIVIYWAVGRECGSVSERSGGERGGGTIAILSHEGCRAYLSRSLRFCSEARRLILHFLWFGRIERAFE
jgi:hypothetical protein